MRVPGIVWAPGRIAAGRVSQALVSTLDVFPTCLALSGGALPPGLVLDGVDQTRVLAGESESVREELAYYRGTRLMAYRRGPWKLHFVTQPGYGGGPVSHDPPLLFHLGKDPSEAYDVGGRYPEVIADLVSTAKRHAGSFVQSPCRFEAPSIRVESKP
jgi:arylsulfatase A-like enzyme